MRGQQGNEEMHPAVLDGCLQVCGAAIGEEVTGLYVPVGIGAVEVNGRDGRAVPEPCADAEWERSRRYAHRRRHCFRPAGQNSGRGAGTLVSPD